MVDVCCLLEVRWGVQSFRILRIDGRRYKFWWSGKDEGVGRMGVVVKVELYEKVVDVRIVGNKVMAVVLIFEEGVLRLICEHALQSGGSLNEKQPL